MTDSNTEIQSTFRGIAGRYDAHIKFYNFIGLRLKDFGVRAAERLRLKRGDCVVDLGCGTGLNFPNILERIGPEGRLTGVDLTAEMLARAKARSDAAGWKNVELVQSDLADYVFPEGIDAVIASGVMGYVPEYGRVIESAARALAPDGHLVLLDGKIPDTWPSWLVKLLFKIKNPLGLNREYFDSRPWESVERCFGETTLEERFGGWVYISAGSKPLR